MRGRSLLAVIVAALAALAACGVPADDSPRAIGSGRLPPDLLEPVSTTPTTDPVGGERTVLVYFLDGAVVRSVTREVASRTPEAALGALVAGVTPEDPPGLSTAIPDGLRVAQVQRIDNTLVVELSAEIGDIGAQLQQAAFAQIVYTATELSGVEGVRFRVGDRDLPVLTDAGAKTEPVGRGDFRSLRPSG